MTRWHPRLRLVVDLLVLTYVFSLDLLDLYFKTQWIGPHDSFSFSAVGSQVLQREPLAASSTTAVRRSGWASFLETCERLFPIGDDFFLHVLAENCRFGPSIGNTSISVPRVIFASSMRVDSVAWAACRLLRGDRRPRVCRSSLVERFAARYNIAETPVLIQPASQGTWTTPAVHALEWDDDEQPWITAPGGAAEAEILELLRVIAESFPLGRVVCVEGFALEGPGHYVATLFGCGSPSRFESALAGVRAPMLARFLQNKAWMTSDRLSVWGLHFLMRENCISRFHVFDQATTATKTLALTLTHRTHINYSSSGPLYVLVIAIDLFVVTVNLLSTAELVATVPWARMRPGHPGLRSGRLVTSDYVGVLTRRMLRSPLFSVLTSASQLVSWTVVLVNSIVWTWTESRWGRVRAFLSTIRFWSLVLVALNSLWNVFVFLTERHAYIFVKRAYVSMFEVLVVSSSVAYVYRETLFAISGDKHALEGQRLADTQAFRGKIAYANAYPEGSEDTLLTPLAVAWTIYRPLVEIIAWSFTGSASIAVMRYLRHMARVCRPRRTHTPTSLIAAAPTALMWAHSGSIKRVGDGPQRIVLQTARGLTATAAPPRRYQRLPIEQILGVPLRARSLIRNWVAMDIEIDDEGRDTNTRRPNASPRGGSTLRVLQSATLVDHGVLVVDGSRLRGRRGFFGTIPTWTTRSAFADPQDRARHLTALR
ncbi:hypothetical protein P43SY_005246 [Pythium insidiosum]|uniref:Transmembrane protein n=1 Tax=Pythium insidiosum TaxID=114742 RepID=A0AAD5LDH8_PYTIN|nr:hypothetical protein P43SY_005246 [Pythium insidiosum]